MEGVGMQKAYLPAVYDGVLASDLAARRRLEDGDHIADARAPHSRDAPILAVDGSEHLVSSTQLSHPRRARAPFVRDGVGEQARQHEEPRISIGQLEEQHKLPLGRQRHVTKEGVPDALRAALPVDDERWAVVVIIPRCKLGERVAIWLGASVAGQLPRVVYLAVAHGTPQVIEVLPAQGESLGPEAKVRVAPVPALWILAEGIPAGAGHHK